MIRFRIFENSDINGNSTADASVLPEYRVTNFDQQKSEEITLLNLNCLMFIKILYNKSLDIFFLIYSTFFNFFQENKEITSYLNNQQSIVHVIDNT